MRFLLAAFDQSHPCSDGSYWTWKHEAIPRTILDKFSYGVASRHWPNGDRNLTAQEVCGGCASLDEWVCCYRFLPGGRDQHGRPGRIVVAAGFGRRAEMTGPEWWGMLQSAFNELAERAPHESPLLPPEKMEYAITMSDGRGGGRQVAWLRSDRTIHLEDSDTAAMLCAQAASEGQGFDCSLASGQTGFRATIELAAPRLSADVLKISSDATTAEPPAPLAPPTKSQPRRPRLRQFMPRWRLIVTHSAALVLGFALGVYLGRLLLQPTQTRIEVAPLTPQSRSTVRLPPTHVDATLPVPKNASHSVGSSLSPRDDSRSVIHPNPSSSAPD